MTYDLSYKKKLGKCENLRQYPFKRRKVRGESLPSPRGGGVEKVKKVKKVKMVNTFSTFFTFGATP